MRVLIFNCTHGRSGHSFLSAVFANITAQLKQLGSVEDPATFFDHAIFCTNVTYKDGGSKGGEHSCWLGREQVFSFTSPDLLAVSTPADDLAQLKTQHELAAAWVETVPTFSADRIHVLPSIEHAAQVARSLVSESSQVDVLVTGSLLLVGGMIEAAGLSEVAL